MPCYKPLQAFTAPGGISFDKSKSFGIPIELPCRRCIGCCLDKSRDWALRCHHESTMYSQNSFVTLTYRDKDLPYEWNLVHEHFQKFIRSLRKSRKTKIRYFMSGEYGSENYRPHYHAILFNIDFPDKTYATTRNDNRVYLSEELNSHWKRGNAEIGSVTYESAGYVARYVLKKAESDPQILYDKYAIIDDDGCMTSRKLEYTRMSLKPGIGEPWYRKFKSDLWPHDYAINPNGQEVPVPTYYRTLLQRENPTLAETLRKARIVNAQNNNSTPERLDVRETIALKKSQKLKRQL